ncbi:gamma-glutamyltransferase family protein [Nesterenkonia sp. F]|uniref:gamma-glutamyltransferase family protein n=1 Tax=Nesterenkonia sp. F TaxID=795955 RepID=UPI0009FCCC5D|nr:gamma-glutamyltransferase [Nesterenkonia sp. F]
MSASTHWLATGAAQSVLERGGNAVDAAVAGAFVLHVAEPHLNGPGGDMTAIFATADAPGEPQVLMGQGAAPQGASVEAYRRLGLQRVPGAGGLAAAVPAAVDAWLLLLAEHGTWPLAYVLEAAIHHAESGVPVLPSIAATIGGVAELFREHWPSSAAQWMPDGQVPATGSLMTNPDYAGVLRSLVAAGEGAASREAAIEAARHEWRTGDVARLATEFLAVPHRHSDGRDHAGVIRAEDFASPAAGVEDPVTITFRGHTIAKIGPWGQGPVLLQALMILAGFDDAELDPGTERGAHLILEALKLAMADRDAYYGDLEPAEAARRMEVLLSEEYAAARRAQLAEAASHAFRPGVVDGVEPATPPLDEPGSDGDAAAAGTGEPTVRGDGEPRGDTCHLDVVDRWGTMISATPSGGWLQSSPTIPGLGFCLGTRLQMTWLDEASPSALRPGRRPRTTLTPTLVLRDGEPVMALGTPGGDQQEQWQLPMLLRVLVGGHTPQQAIDAPTLHTTSMPGSFFPRTWEPGGAVVEDRLGEEVIAGLTARGHRITRAGDWALGRLSCVTRDPATGRLGAAANPRGAQGYAAGR